MFYRSRDNLEEVGGLTLDGGKEQSCGNVGASLVDIEQMTLGSRESARVPGLEVERTRIMIISLSSPYIPLIAVCLPHDCKSID